MRANPQPYQIYKHFKGNLYQVLTLASDSESQDTLVVYQALYSPYKVWVRPLTMFMSEVDHNKYPSVIQEYRFELQSDLPNGKMDSLQKQETKVTEAENPEEGDFDDVVLEPLVLEFLESDTYEQKLNILASLHSRITDEMINTMAIAMDVEIGEGDIERRFSELKNCIYTLKKYECSRVR